MDIPLAPFLAVVGLVWFTFALRWLCPGLAMKYAITSSVVIAVSAVALTVARQNNAAAYPMLIAAGWTLHIAVTAIVLGFVAKRLSPSFELKSFLLVMLAIALVPLVLMGGTANMQGFVATMGSAFGVGVSIALKKALPMIKFRMLIGVSMAWIGAGLIAGFLQYSSFVVQFYAAGAIGPRSLFFLVGALGTLTFVGLGGGMTIIAVRSARGAA